MTLREIRENAQLRQEDVAKKLLVDQSAVSNWERGTAKPLTKYRKKLARIYKVPLSELEAAIGG